MRVPPNSKNNKPLSVQIAEALGKRVRYREIQFAGPNDCHLPRSWEAFPIVKEDPRGGLWEGVWEQAHWLDEYDEYWEEVPEYENDWRAIGEIVHIVEPELTPLSIAQKVLKKLKGKI